MSYACLVIGESGSGKTASLRNFNQAEVLLIQPVRKPLPFRAQGWKEARTKGDGGNIFVCSDAQKIIRAMRAASQSIIVIDDWQYILASQFMARRSEKSFDKFTDIGGAGYDIVKAASELAPEKRVYVLSHCATDENGVTHIKTLGRLLDEKIVVEGLFSIVLKTFVDPGQDGGFYFTTKNSGHDTVKSPMGMFEAPIIENDLAAVDRVICSYYGLDEAPEAESKSAQEEVPFAVSVKADELLSAMKDATDMDVLTKLAAQVAGLNLPEASKQRHDLMAAYKTAKERIFDELNNL